VSLFVLHRKRDFAEARNFYDRIFLNPSGLDFPAALCFAVVSATSPSGATREGEAGQGPADGRAAKCGARANFSRQLCSSA